MERILTMKRDLMTGALWGVVLAAWVYAGLLSIGACAAPQDAGEEAEELIIINDPLTTSVEGGGWTIDDPSERELAALGIIVGGLCFIAWTRRKRGE